MGTSTEFQLDPDKAWTEHTHLGWTKDDKGRPVMRKDKAAELARLKPLYDTVAELKHKLSRGDGAGIKLYNDFRLINEANNYSQMAAELHRLVAMDPELSLNVDDAETNPVDVFMRTPELESAQAIRDHWNAALLKQLTAASQYLTDRKGRIAEATPAEQSGWLEYLTPLELKIKAVHEALARSGQAPYFHLGRFGDHFVAFGVAVGEDGLVRTDALEAVAEALKAEGIEDAQISTDNTKPRVMLRVENKDTRVRLARLALDLAAKGFVDRDSVKDGPRMQANNFGVADGVPSFVARLINSIETADRYKPTPEMSDKARAALEQRKADEIQAVMDAWLESQPDTAISKVLTKRYTVAGYNPDMVRNWAHRLRVGTIHLANVAAAPKLDRAYNVMRDQYEQALSSTAAGDPDVVNDLYTEMKSRDALNPVRDNADSFEKARALAHSYFLGLSPAYMFLNLTQLGVTALPELAKGHGYRQAFHAMRRAGAQAFAILKAAGEEARALGPERWADIAITESVIAKAGLSKDIQNFALHMMASGSIDIGSASRALAQIAEARKGSKLDIALKYASALGTYSETFSRLTAALAARELKGGSGPEVETYAKRVVSNAMFDFQSDNTARMLGRGGVLGPVTPIVTQFMQYSIQMVEKLVSEIVDAVGTARAGETAEAAATRRREARQFLAGHMAAVTFLSGSLGLPFTTVFATVLEKLVDALDDDDEPFDATAAYRGWLADVLGKDMAEALARGVPRALGFDLSQRAGEQNLLPFSEFLADRRSWKDAVTEQAGRSIGAAPGMIINILDGGEQIANGDVLAGLKSMLPVGLKSVVEAYRMTDQGYVDTKGNKLPLSPGASAVIWQLLGFAPAEKAEYNEARGEQMVRRGEISRKASQLRQRIIKAMMEGDQETARELVGDAIEFDKANPAFAVVPSLSGSIQRQQEARARAAALKAPVGVSMRDIAGQQLTRYANVDYVN